MNDNQTPGTVAILGPAGWAKLDGYGRVSVNPRALLIKNCLQSDLLYFLDAYLCENWFISAQRNWIKYLHAIVWQPGEHI